MTTTPTDNTSSAYLPLDVAAERAMIDDVVATVDHAMEHELVDAFVGLFRDDGISTTAHGKRLFGRAAIAEFTAQVLPGSTGPGRTTYEVERVLFIRPDVAAVKVRQREVDADGGLVGQGSPLYVMSKENGRWQLAITQNTVVKDPDR